MHASRRRRAVAIENHAWRLRDFWRSVTETMPNRSYEGFQKSHFTAWTRAIEQG